MKDLYPDDYSLDANDKFWSIGHRKAVLDQLEYTTPSLQAASAAFGTLELHRRILLDYFYSDNDTEIERNTDLLLTGCKRIGLEFSNYLLTYFAETPDSGERINQTEDVFIAIDESHRELLITMSDEGQEPIWDPETTATILKELYDEVPETAFIHMIQQHIESKLERMICKVID